MGVSEKQLRKQEYLYAFDTFCDKLANKLDLREKHKGLSPACFSSLSELRETRLQQMLAAYYKYGPVRANYITYQLMLPLQEAVMRIIQYEKTKNVEFLLDSINFLMLEYWQYTTDVIAIPDDVLMVYSAVVLQIRECTVKLSKCVMKCLQEYNETDDLIWIGIIALLVQQEIQVPSYVDVQYKYTAGNNIEVAGTYIKELEDWAQERKK